MKGYGSVRKRSESQKNLETILNNLDLVIQANEGISIDIVESRALDRVPLKSISVGSAGAIEMYKQESFASSRDSKNNNGMQL